ncbi:MAG: hypothetical protein HYU99_05585 [Deltaproteobacteria bacterium]|nr:hypothetical protein [Deltaproteobacteria bacterium]
MTREEVLLRELCREVANVGVQSDRFTELWLATGVNLDSCELDIANKILQRSEEISGHARVQLKTIH